VISRWLGAAAGASLLIAATAGGASAATGAIAATGSIWQVVSSVNPEAGQVTDSSLSGVSAVSATDGWAVGTFSDSDALSHPLVEYWNGSSFARVSAPEPAGKQASLSGVDELSASDAWAVGTSAEGVAGDNNTDDEPLIEHWTGSKWVMAAGVSLPAGATGDLEAIGGTGPDDLWAAGFSLSSSDGFFQLLLEHYDGTGWKSVGFPTQDNACAIGASNCLLVPEGVSATSPDDVWVVGKVFEPNPTANFIAHWDGTKWSVVLAPCLQGETVTTACPLTSQDTNGLTGVTAVSSTDAYASGSEGNTNDQNVDVPYVLHWNGTAWTLVKTPNLGGEGIMLNGITALSASDVWAVGQSEGDTGLIRPVTEQFNGTTWNLVPSPAPGSSSTWSEDSLDGVASPGGGRVFAVGARDIPGECCLRTLALTTASG
jgi:hypothetical protein